MNYFFYLKFNIINNNNVSKIKNKNLKQLHNINL